MGERQGKSTLIQYQSRQKWQQNPPLLLLNLKYSLLQQNWTIRRKLTPQHVSHTLSFLKIMGISKPVPENCNTHDFYSDIVRSCLKVDDIQGGRITCTFIVKPPISNFFKSLHGRAFAVAVELLSIACARTFVVKDKELFLGEISMAYLSGAPQNLQADGSVVKSGRNVTAVALEFKQKKTGKLIYTARATFYNLPVVKL